MHFRNTYEDARYAAAYAALEFPGTYALAFRDLPDVFARHVKGQRALDFGCGAGRSTRLLRRLGFDAVGVDISPEMIRLARKTDPTGAYRLIGPGDLAAPGSEPLDLILCAFPFDNIPTMENKARTLESLGSLLAEGGRIVNLVSSPEIYLHEWASFSTKAFPENRLAQSGDVVRIINLAVDGSVPTEDVLWTGEAWAETYRRAGLSILDTIRPLGDAGDPGPWVNEVRIPPWVIYVLARSAAAAQAHRGDGDRT
jgi:SAM-dependent methyltransferase